MIPRAFEVRVCENCGYRDISVYLNHGHPICAECWKQKNGKAIYEYHHLYGRTRDDTILIPANHHAYITTVRNNWPKVLHKFSEDPILQIAYSQRNINDLLGWYLNHPDSFSKGSSRGSILHVLQAVTVNLENYSDWVIALQRVLVNEKGNKYYEKIGIAPLLFKSLYKDR
jgi:hypothetical protein